MGRDLAGAACWRNVGKFTGEHYRKAVIPPPNAQGLIRPSLPPAHPSRVFSGI